MTLRVLCLLLLVLVAAQARSMDKCGTALRQYKRSATEIVVMHPETSPNKRENRRPKVWDRWTKWSPCNVSCGVGKLTRWRHCVAGGCAPGEKEAQIKTCTLSPC
nr:PREDICTED: uncharacterized protein LOC107398608 [Tribolium castaneum]|eukprot:XP_015838684.1 PREDICTED: uncharacterized protein LOC107398608 [Tribolium castaneum]